MGQLTDGLNALIRYANETTGASDATISAAVETLVNGYGQGGGDMPTFYEWVMPSEHINWGAYIDTGVAVPSVGSTIRISIDYDNLNRDSVKILGSTLSNGNSSEGCLTMYSPTSLRFDVANDGLLAWGMNDRLHHANVVWKLGDSSYDFSPRFSLDGQSGGFTFDTQSPLPQGNFSLFGYYVSAWGRVGVDQTKCYGLRIWINNVLVFDGKPAMDANGAGMYDLVSGTMKYNASSAGELICGND